MIPYKPSAYYFRKALRSARTKAEAVDVGLVAVRELEALKKWVRDQGMIPPRRFVLSTEIDDKNLSLLRAVEIRPIGPAVLRPGQPQTSHDSSASSAR